MTSWQKLRDEAAQCTRCDLYRRATQTVFGEGRTGVPSRWSVSSRVTRRTNRVIPELGAVRPRLVVLLGAVAGEAMFGSRYRVGEHKGKAEEASFGSWRGLVVGTIHPSAVLRGPDSEARDRVYAGLVADLAAAREAAAEAA